MVKNPPVMQECCAVLSHSVVSNSLQPYELYSARLLCPWRFSRQEYQSGQTVPPPGDLPDPGINLGSPTLHVDSLPAELPGKPKNTGVHSLFPLQGNFPAQELNQGLLHCRWILYQVSYQEDPAMQGPGFNPWFGKIPWRRAWQPTLVFLPGESPWAEEPGRVQSMGFQRVRHD